MNSPLPRVVSIFSDALACKSPAELAEVLDRACVGDGELRSVVEKLLAAHHAAAGDFESRVVAMHDDPSRTVQLSDDSQRDQSTEYRLACEGTARIDWQDAGFSPADARDASLPGTPSHGRFRVLRSHAAGGLGEVFVAHDSELNRDVALKQIHSRYAGHAESRSRFLLEAEITGGLEHPGIVPVYGLGADDDDGRPYYAMRFIRGYSLHDAIQSFHQADQNVHRDSAERSLALRELLTRFRSVCLAIEYAHSRSVLHRDLKPSNIMLGKYGETLVVDWGLAKPLGRPLRESLTSEAPLAPALSGDSSPTQMGVVVGTPAFMSPEQAAGQLDQLSAGSDVYGLAATLYMLLVGQPPFRRREGESDLAPVLLRVQQGDFPRPRAVNPRVPAALEAVCLKGLALRPEERYASPQDMAHEIDRWLADEPVDAHREPLPARARRWIRKHPGPVTGLAATVVLGLLGSGTLAYLNGKHAQELSGKNTTITQQKEDLEDANLRLAEEKATAEAATGFLVQSFRKADPDQDGRKLTVYEVLVRASQELDEKSDLDPLQRAAILDALGQSFLGLGFYDESITATERALAIRREFQGADHPDTLISMNNLAASYNSAGELDLALPLLEETLRLMKAKLGDDHPDTLISMNNLAASYNSAGKLDLALPLLEETLRLMKAKLGDDHPDTLLSMNNLAEGHRSVGKLDLALPLYEETLRLTRAKFGDDHPSTLVSMNNLALGYQSAGKLELALPLYKESLRLRKAKLGDDHPKTLLSMNNLAYGYQSAGKLDLALPLLEETLRLSKAKLGDDHPDTLKSMNNLAAGYDSADKLDLAVPMLEETLRLRKIKLGEDHPDTLMTMNNLAAGYEAAGKLGLALPLHEETLRLTKAKLGDDHPATLTSMNNLAEGYRSAGKLNLALSLSQETLRLMKAKLGDDHPDTLATMNNRAVAFLDAKQGAKAIQLFDEYLVLQRTKQGPNDPDFAATLAAVSERLLTAGQFSSVEPYLKECLEIRLATQPDEWTTFNTQSMLGGSLLGQQKYAEAEPLLLAGYEGLRQRTDKIPAAAQVRVTEALQRLVELYNAWDKPEEAANWKSTLTELEAARPKPDDDDDAAPATRDALRTICYNNPSNSVTSSAK